VRPSVSAPSPRQLLLDGVLRLREVPRPIWDTAPHLGTQLSNTASLSLAALHGGFPNKVRCAMKTVKGGWTKAWGIMQMLSPAAPRCALS
jgi:hypothetical protein